MERLFLKATTTTTELGVFSAVISAVSVDREGDRVDPEAMVKALRAWVPTGKLVPLHWNHSGAAEDIFGTIDPESAKAIDGEVHVDGKVDMESPRGKDAWRLIKSGAMGFSFGYLVPEGGAKTNEFGGKDIFALDVFEVTGTTTPMNNDTRVTGWKSAKQLTSALREQLESAGRDRFGGDKTWVYVDDFDPSAGYAVFCVCPEGEGMTYQKVSYTVDGASITLAADTTEVARTVAYREKGADPLRRQADEVALSVAAGEEEPPGKTAAEVERDALAAAVKSIVEGFGEDSPTFDKENVPEQAVETLERLVKSIQEAREERKSVEVTGKEHARPVDPLRKQADRVAVEVTLGDTDVSHVKGPEPARKPEPELTLQELKARTREATLQVLTGGI